MEEVRRLQSLLDEREREIEALSLIHQKELRDLLTFLLTEKEKETEILQERTGSLEIKLNDATASLQESLERERVTEGLSVELDITRNEMIVQRTVISRNLEDVIADRDEKIILIGTERE
jgi:hypothetical protein